MTQKNIVGIDLVDTVNRRLQSDCPTPARWWSIKLAKQSWTNREIQHINHCQSCQNTKRLLEIDVPKDTQSIVIEGKPHDHSRGWLAITTAAAVLIGIAAWSHEKNTALALSKQVSSLTAMLANLETLIQTLGIPNAVRFEESPFRVIGRDQIGLTVLFDKRYVSRIQVRWTQDEPFRTVFEATSTRPETETISELSKQSGPLSLNGDVIMPELRIETYDDVTDYIPEDKRNQSRRFALTPLGVTADPPALSETPVDVITHDSNAEEPNRYTVHGRLPRNQEGELPARSYLLIYPLLSDECWVSDVIVPAADGRFFVKCYLGTQVDQQRYMLKVISYYGSSKDSPAYKPGERFEKTIDWTEKGFRQFDGGFKTNNGTHGFDIHD